MTGLGIRQQREVPFLDLAAMHAGLWDELDAVWRDIAATGSFIGGPALARFEQEWADYCGARRAVGVANGTDAIELTLRYLDLQPGDEVVVPANTFVATVEAIVLAGGTPRFADVEPDTLLVSAGTIEPLLGDRTAAVIVVHLYGGMPDMDEILALTAAAGVPVIEDAAQAHGSTYGDRRAGSLGLAGCFSFYPGKNLGAFGDGGAVVTDDGALAEHLSSYGNHGRDPHDKHLHPIRGSNSRLDGLQAAVLARKLAWLDEWNRGRRRAAARYDELLAPLDADPVATLPQVTSAHHLYVVQVAERDRVRARLAEHGVATGLHYPIPCHQQPAYRDFATGALPVVEGSAGRIISLPMHPHLDEDDLQHVCAALADALEETG